MSEDHLGICGLAVLGCLQGPDAVFKDEGRTRVRGSFWASSRSRSRRDVAPPATAMHLRAFTVQVRPCCQARYPFLMQPRLLCHANAFPLA